MGEQPIVKYSIADAEIAKLSEKYMALSIADTKDKQGFEIVRSARMDIKSKRVQVEKTRVELKADALRYGKAVDAEAKRLTSLLEPIESHLAQQEKIYTDEQDRIKREKEIAAAARLQERIDDLQAFGATINLDALRAMSDADYATTLRSAEAAWQAAEEKRKAEAEEAAKREATMKAERERLAQEQAAAEKAKREAMAAQAAAEKAIRDAQETERAAAAKVRAEQEKAAAIEKAKADEAARLRAEAEAKARREAEEAERKARIEAMRPDREKIIALASRLDHIAAEIAEAEPDSIMDQAQDIIFQAGIDLRNLTIEEKK